MALLSRARDITTSLESGKACCPMCLSELTDGFSCNEAALDEARRKLHAFWDACMDSLISAHLTPDFIASKWGEQRRNGRVATDACPLHERPTDRDILHEFVRAACLCLHVALSSGASCAVRRAAHSKRTLENKAGSWPRSLRQLFAHDARKGTNSMMMWAAQLRTPEPLLLLADMVLIAHPLVCSEIVRNPPLHRDLMRTIPVRIGLFASRKMDGAEGQREASLAQSQLRTDNMAAAVRFLTSIGSAPDALPEAFVAVATGFEPALWHSLESAMSTMDPQNPFFQSFLPPMTALGYLLPPPPPSMVIIPGLMDCLLPLGAVTFADILFAAFHMVGNARRFCHRCWRPALTADLMTPEGGDTHFCVCDRCRLARYCGRDCQLADWKDGEPAQHRAVCPLLARIRTATETAGFKGSQDDLDALGFSLREKITLSLFSLNPKLLHVAMLVRAADIHREFLGDDEYPPASAKALARVDLLKNGLDSKMALIATRLQARFCRDNLPPSRE